MDAAGLLDPAGLDTAQAEPDFELHRVAAAGGAAGEPHGPAFDGGTGSTTGERLLYWKRGVLVSVTLVGVDRTAMPPEQEVDRDYTVRLESGQERNTIGRNLFWPSEGAGNSSTAARSANRADRHQPPQP